jgi:hypothetical protein
MTYELSLFGITDRNCDLLIIILISYFLKPYFYDKLFRNIISDKINTEINILVHLGTGFVVLQIAILKYMP